MHYNTNIYICTTILLVYNALNTSVSARLQRIHVGDYYVCCSALHGTCLQWVFYKRYNNIPVTRCRPLTCSIVMTKYQSEHARHVSLKGPFLLPTNLKPNVKLLSTYACKLCSKAGTYLCSTCTHGYISSNHKCIVSDPEEKDGSVFLALFRNLLTWHIQ